MFNVYFCLYCPLRGNITPFFSARFVHCPLVLPGVSTDLPGDLQTLLPWLQSRHQLSHCPTLPPGLEVAGLTWSVLDNSLHHLLTLWAALGYTTVQYVREGQELQ